MAVAAQCPSDARPVAELAGVPLSQRRWSEASELASAALALDPTIAFAADVLGSSRFMLNDSDGALRAWNVARKPMLDAVHITGLSRTRYSLLAQAIDLPSDALLTADAFTLARRRLESMPDLASTRLSLRPGDDGFAVADVAVVERATLPRSPVQWAAASVQAALEREVTARLPGRTGQGETWTAAWGWWENRPSASVEFAAPLVSHPRGIWRVALAWQAQTYGSTPVAVREEQLLGDLGYSSWLSANSASISPLASTHGPDQTRRRNGQSTLQAPSSVACSPTGSPRACRSADGPASADERDSVRRRWNCLSRRRRIPVRLSPSSASAPPPRVILRRSHCGAEPVKAKPAHRSSAHTRFCTTDG